MKFRHQPLQQLLDYWNDKRQGRELPFRDAIDPMELRFALGNILLAEIVRGDSLRFRYRLWGSKLTEDYGAEMTGRHVDELLPSALAVRVQQSYVDVVATGLPQHQQFNNVIDGRLFIHERLLLPLALRDDPEKIGMIMGGVFRSPRPA
ncbi:MAG: PAS domain-containing protein [Ferrovibrio sp.]